MEKIIISKSMFVTCPSCNKDFDVVSDEYKYFNCPHCEGSFKYLKMDYKRKDLCVFCKWHRDERFSEDEGRCYLKTRNLIDIDTFGYDYNSENYDSVKQYNTTCDCFEVRTEGEYSHLDKEYLINKSYEVEGYRGFWRGLDSFRFDKNDIDDIPNDYIIKLNELSEGEVYSIAKNEFIEKCTTYDDTYCLPFSHWNIIYKPIKIEKEKQEFTSNNCQNGFTKERFLELCERVKNQNY